MKEWTVALVGAGKIGRMISTLLIESGDYRVTVFDQSQKALDALNVEGLTTKQLDVADEELLTKALGDYDAVLSAAPFFLTPVIARAAKNSGTHYFDLTEDVACTEQVEALAQESATAFAPQCGLAPGFVSIAGHDLAKRFDKLEKLTLRVGALPRFPTNRLKYNLTWSTDGLINEYCNPCLAIEDGKLTKVAPLEGLEVFSLEGVEYEAFNTSGGLGSLTQSLDGKVDELRYLSIRYPGHKEIMGLLLKDLGLHKRRDLLKEVMEASVPSTKQDIVLVFITASGYVNGRLEEASYLNKTESLELFGRMWSAIQITTAAGICATLDLMREGKVPSKGFVRQEDIPLDLFLSNRFGAFYSGAKSLVSTPATPSLAAE
ncbi:saccharopine dehydrogenase family protein [Flexibacterium corallicola]|uniref:saccharopine dehydrogenase family protein n=1 Tax=Flexibacterium corallicola TaxID=3037259 RepID=UPI00286F60E9|nr:saccharopine dehydrogenase C-terminal domain-containing protein [Pseudovibrio sp. M1P-2-3]